MNPNTAIQKPESAPSGVFVSTLTALKNGQFVNQLDDALRDVTRAVSEQKRKGLVTLTIAIEPNGIGAGDIPLYRVRPEISTKLPKPPETAQTFFADDDHNLSRRMPGQTDMRLELVPSSTPVPAKAAPEAPAADKVANA